jgi:hypothetical protein
LQESTWRSILTYLLYSRYSWASFRSSNTLTDIDVEIYSELVSSYFPHDPEGALTAATERASLDEHNNIAEVDNVEADQVLAEDEEFDLDKFPKIAKTMLNHRKSRSDGNSETGSFSYDAGPDGNKPFDFNQDFI